MPSYVKTYEIASHGITSSGMFSRGSVSYETTSGGTIRFASHLFLVEQLMIGDCKFHQSRFNIKWMNLARKFVSDTKGTCHQLLRRALACCETSYEAAVLIAAHVGLHHSAIGNSRGLKDCN